LSIKAYYLSKGYFSAGCASLEDDGPFEKFDIPDRAVLSDILDLLTNALALFYL